MCFDIKTKIPKAEEYSYLSQKKKRKKENKENKTNLSNSLEVSKLKQRQGPCMPKVLPALSEPPHIPYAIDEIYNKCNFKDNFFIEASKVRNLFL